MDRPIFLLYFYEGNWLLCVPCSPLPPEAPLYYGDKPFVYWGMPGFAVCHQPHCKTEMGFVRNLCSAAFPPGHGSGPDRAAGVPQ